MNYREADGSDKIAAFERGMTDAEAAMVFETPGVSAFIVNGTFLVAYTLVRNRMVVVLRKRLYSNDPTGNAAVDEFLDAEARKFQVTVIAHRV